VSGVVLQSPPLTAAWIKTHCAENFKAVSHLAVVLVVVMAGGAGDDCVDGCCCCCK